MKDSFTATSDGNGFVNVPTTMVAPSTGFVVGTRIADSNNGFALPYTNNTNSRFTICCKKWDMTAIANTSIKVEILYKLI